MTPVDILDYNELDTCIYRAEATANIAGMWYMAPLTVTFDHGFTLPDGTVVDLAKPGAAYVTDVDGAGGVVRCRNSGELLTLSRSAGHKEKAVGNTHGSLCLLLGILQKR